MVTFSVLGTLAAKTDAGDAVGLRGPKHRAVLTRLLIARGRTVPIETLIDDLWEVAPARARGSIRTFVGDLRRALEPDRAPRTASALLITDGAGYALRPTPGSVDAERFEKSVTAARSRPAEDARVLLRDALGLWRGPAYADIGDAPWARAERSRLVELRLHALEEQARALVDLNRAPEAVPELDAHVTDHPWREEGWRLLALALYRTGRQADALQVLRRAQHRLADELGLDPGPRLSRLQSDILAQASSLDAPESADGTHAVWSRVMDRSARASLGERARLRGSVDMLRSLAIAGGDDLDAAQRQRLAAVQAAEELGDPDLTARVIGAYDVPAVWSRSDHPDIAERIVAAAHRSLDALPAPVGTATRIRLLATIAIETRGPTSPAARAHARDAADTALALARTLEDPALIAVALNGVFMQSFHRAGLAPTRDGIGTELINLARRHDLVPFELLGRLIRIQARCALGDVATADAEADAADALATRFESPLVQVFTDGYRALRQELTAAPLGQVRATYRTAAPSLEHSGMVGLRADMLELPRLALHLRHALPLPAPHSTDWSPHAPWVEPLLLARGGHADAARAALAATPEPPADHLLEAHWCLTALAAHALGDRAVLARAQSALAPARAEQAGAGSGILTFGPVADYLAL